MTILSRRSFFDRFVAGIGFGIWVMIGCAGAQDFAYTVTNGTITITGYKGSGGVVSVPATVSGMPVTSIAAYAFDVFLGNTDAASVIIPDSVTHMGADSAGPENGYVFNECQNLTNIVIGNGVTNIAGPLLWSCPNVATITVGEFNSAYSSQNGVLFNKNATALIRCPPAPKVLTIPASVTDVRNSACAGCLNLEQVVIPNSVTNIGDSAFWICGVTNISVPAGVTKIGNAAFGLCTSLKSVYCKGNAPSQGVSIFGFGDAYTNTTVYYTPGTTGWTSLFGGRPTALWNPQVQTSDGSFGVRQSGFGFNIAGTAGIPLVIEAGMGAAGSWIPIQSCMLTNGLIYFNDPRWTNYPSRFYRIRSP